MEINKQPIKEQPPKISDQISNTIEGIMSRCVEEDKKTFLSSELSKLYGKKLADKIISFLPVEFFQYEKSIETNESISTTNESATADIISAIENSDDPVSVIAKELEKENVSKEKIESFVKTKDWKKLVTIGSIAAILFATLLIKKGKEGAVEESSENLNHKIEKKNIAKKINKEKNVDFNERFNTNTYESLSKEGREVYKYFAENNPTPGRYYQILNKEEGKIYVIDNNNNLIAKINAGFGKDEGDDNNTSFIYNKGKMTTPSGIYLFSESALASDVEEYGPLQFSLFGKSIKGETVTIAEHSTYSKHGQLEIRTEKLQSESPEDNKFSNGCINIDPEDFKKDIRVNFVGDYGEFLIVLPDEKSRKEGNKFDIKALVENAMPMMLDRLIYAETAYRGFREELTNTINTDLEQIANLKNRQNELTRLYQKDKDNNKQIEIARIKIQIRGLKTKIGQNRTKLGEFDKKINEFGARIKNIETILSK